MPTKDYCIGAITPAEISILKIHLSALITLSVNLLVEGSLAETQETHEKNLKNLLETIDEGYWKTLKIAKEKINDIKI